MISLEVVVKLRKDFLGEKESPISYVYSSGGGVKLRFT